MIWFSTFSALIPFIFLDRLQLDPVVFLLPLRRLRDPLGRVLLQGQPEGVKGVQEEHDAGSSPGVGAGATLERQSTQTFPGERIFHFCFETLNFMCKSEVRLNNKCKQLLSINRRDFYE